MIYAVNTISKEHKELPDYFSQDASFYLENDGDRWDIIRADADGWITWNGEVECPLPNNQEFEIRYKDGKEKKLSRPQVHNWQSKADRTGDRRWVAYRPILDAKPELHAWDGEGLPPVGCECEVMYCEKWRRCEIIAHFKQRVSMVAAFTIDIGDGAKMFDAFAADCFRPIRSEEDRAIEAMCEVFKSKIGTDESIYEALYQAIRDGKVPGVKLTGDE